MIPEEEDSDWLDLDDRELIGATRPMLYHYTDAAGLTGFVKSECRLLASHHEYVNDSDEIRYGHKIALEVLKSLDIDDEPKQFAIDKSTELVEGPSFIACLSADQNVLPQWRLYANETVGYCLGFRDLRTAIYTTGSYDADQDALAYTLRECIYGAHKLRTQLEARCQREIKHHKRYVRDDKNKVMGSSLAHVAWRYAQLAKHEHFQFESEWRFVVWESDPAIEYRLTRRGLTPYLFTDKLKLEEVWIGPGIGASNPDKAASDVTKFLAEHGLTAKVHHWSTSYRR